MSAAEARITISGRPLAGADVSTLVRLRALAIVGQTAALLISVFVLEIEVPVAPLAAGVAIFAVVNLLTWDRVNRGPSLDDRLFFREILVDIGVLTYLLCLAGGPENPFHDMYLLPLTIAAAALPWRYVWRVAAASIGCYTLVYFVYVPFRADLAWLGTFLLIAEWVNHGLIAVLTAYFVVRIAGGVRERDRLLMDAHEREVRNGCAVTLGSAAAGVAHELGTPLSTMSILLGQIRQRSDLDSGLRKELDTLGDALGACKSSLSNFRTFVQTSSRGCSGVALDCFLRSTVERFREIRPGVEVTAVVGGDTPPPVVLPDLSLQQSMINLLSNAAQVSPLDVTFTATWDEDSLTIAVNDRGPGFSSEVADRLGRILVTTKPPEGGTGLGLFLTNVTMHRLGGRMRLQNRISGGACAELTIPFSSILPQQREAA